MCRHIAYLGPRISLAALLCEPEHSLIDQSWQPRFQVQGRINADGFGVAWYEPTVASEPVRYRTTKPIWSDRSFASIAPAIFSGSIVASVRDATPPIAVDESANQPFISGRWTFSHNGSLDEYIPRARTELMGMISDSRLAAIHSASDSELLFAYVLTKLDEGAVADEAVADAVSVARKISGGRMNFLLTDGSVLVGTKCGDSLFRQDGEAKIVASEPFDDSADWTDISDETMIAWDSQGVFSTYSL